MGIFFILFFILWILVTIFLPVKDMIEARLLKTPVAVTEVKVKDEAVESKQVEEPETNDSKYSLYPKSGYCDVCSKMVKPHEGYLVPVDTFYDSPEYRDYLKMHPKAKSVIASKGIDTYINEMRANDKTEYSTICPDCIFMFED